MNGFWTVFRREVDERRLLLLAALVLGALPFAAVLVPTPLGRELAHGRLAVAAMLALVATAITAIALGASVIARDLAERRLGFYFQRPLSGWALWGGKIASAAGLSLATGALIALPAVLADLSQDTALPGGGWIVPATIGALLLLLGLSHAGSIILRARSPWLLLDLAGSLLVGGLLLRADAALVRIGLVGIGPGYDAANLATYGHLGVAGAVLLAGLAAGAVQLLTARTDLRRGHRALSLVFWSGLLAAALAFWGLVHWTIRATPGDLRSVQWAEAAPAGSWVAVKGTAAHRPGYRPQFLVDSGSGRFLRLLAGPLSTSRSSLTLSRDGRRAAWLEAQGPAYFSPSTLVLADLTARDPKATETVLSFGYPPEGIALSPAGDRLAVVEENRLRLFELPDGKILASAAIPRAYAWQRHLLFVTDGRVRLFQGDDERWPLRLGKSYEVFDLGEGTPGLVQRSHFEAIADWPPFNVSGDGRYLSARVAERPVILDVEAGREILDLTPAEPGVRLGQLAFLSDGRMAQIQIVGRARRLRLLDRSFHQERMIPLPGERPVLIGDLLSPGSLVVALLGAETLDHRQTSTAFLADLSTGTVRPLGRGLVPAVPDLWGEASTTLLSRGLFLRGHGLVRVDLQTGRETVIVPTGSAG